MNFLKKNGAGLLLCLAISIPAWFLGKSFPVIGGPVFAILIGMVLTLILKEKEPFTAGINYTSKKILQAAVIFLGFGMNLSQILAGGKQSLPISVIFLFNVLAALIFPTLGAVLGLSNEGFGLFAGTAINDTSSVTAAAAAWDGIHASHTLETATIVKMTRTLAIIPITLALAFYREKKEKKEEGSSFSFKKSFPFFVLFFILASVVTTIFHLPAAVTGPLKELSKFLIVMAMAAIGLNTNIVHLVKTGAKPIFTGFCCWVGISLVSLGMQHMMGLW